MLDSPDWLDVGYVIIIIIFFFVSNYGGHRVRRQQPVYVLRAMMAVGRWHLLLNKTPNTAEFISASFGCAEAMLRRTSSRATARIVYTAML